MPHRFRSVVVITLASHARGPGFEPQRNLVYFIKVIEHTFKHEIKYPSPIQSCRSLLSIYLLISALSHSSPKTVVHVKHFGMDVQHNAEDEPKE